jgi:hypothetical protein
MRTSFFGTTRNQIKKNNVAAAKRWPMKIAWPLSAGDL